MLAHLMRSGHVVPRGTDRAPRMHAIWMLAASSYGPEQRGSADTMHAAPAWQGVALHTRSSHSSAYGTRLRPPRGVRACGRKHLAARASSTAFSAGAATGHRPLPTLVLIHHTAPPRFTSHFRGLHRRMCWRMQSSHFTRLCTSPCQDS